MDNRPRKRHGECSFDLRISTITDIEIEDFENPWAFHTLFMSSDEVVFQWLRNHDVLSSPLARSET